MNNTEYTQSELSRINHLNEFGTKFKITDDKGETKFVNINRESATALVEWLTNNFIRTPSDLIAEADNFVRVGDAYNRYRGGEHLNNRELDRLIEVTQTLYDNIVRLQDSMFDLFKSRILHDLDVFKELREARRK